MKKIAILTPTRERYIPCARMVNTALKSAAHPERVQMWLYVDDDDPQADMYDKHIGTLEGVHMISGPSDGVGKAWNRMAHAAYSNDCEWFMMGNDDLVWEEAGAWDDYLEERTREYPDGIYCAFFADGIQHAKHAAFPIISRTWLNAVGHFVPEIFRFGKHDTWITDIGNKLDRMLYMPEIMVRHHHHSRGGVRDRTTARNTRHWPHDQQVFKKPGVVAMREREAEILRELMQDV